MFFKFLGFESIYTVIVEASKIKSAMCKVMLLVDCTQSTSIVTEPVVVKFPSIIKGSSATSYERGRIDRGRRRSSPSRTLLLTPFNGLADINATNIE